MAPRLLEEKILKYEKMGALGEIHLIAVDYRNGLVKLLL
jgi:hypothetical protein